MLLAEIIREKNKNLKIPTHMEVCRGELTWKVGSDTKMSEPRAKREEKSTILLHSQFFFSVGV